jgi:hypothetical protein
MIPARAARRGRPRRQPAGRAWAVLLALPLLTGCAALGASAAPTARLHAAETARTDRADVACSHGVTFR